MRYRGEKTLLRQAKDEGQVSKQERTPEADRSATGWVRLRVLRMFANDTPASYL